MNAKELSLHLNNRPYDFTNSDRFKELIEEAKQNNLIIVVGSSDDLCEFYGKIEEEVGFYSDNVEIFIDKNSVYHESVGEVPNDTSGMNSIKIQTNKNNQMFLFSTDIKDVQWFDILENDMPEIYCNGFVIDGNNLK